MMKQRFLPVRFSLRVLCVTLLLACFAASWLGSRVRAGRRQEQAALAMGKTGSIVLYDHYFDGKGRFITGLPPSPPQPRWIRKLFGENTFATVRSIEFGATFTNDDVRHLQYILGFDRVDLSDREMTDGQLSHVAHLTDLTWLDLSRNRSLTGRGFAKLDSLKQLTYLDLSECRSVTDAGIAELKRLPQLTELNLSGCVAISGQGLSQLKSLKTLTRLNLSTCTAIGDPGWTAVAQLKELRSLTLSDTAISDQGMEQLSRLPKLRYLSISNGNLSSRSLRFVSKIDTLESLRLDRCGISLREALDNLSNAGQYDPLDILDLLGCLNGDQLTVRLPFDDDDLSLLKCANHVVSLELYSQTLGNDGLSHLETFSKLEQLTLDSARIDRRAVPHLSKLRNLKQLSVENAWDLGVLKKELPNLEIW